jgi:hypothetical protein
MEEALCGGTVSFKAFVCWAWNFGGHQLVAKIGGLSETHLSPRECPSRSLAACAPLPAPGDGTNSVFAVKTTSSV